MTKSRPCATVPQVASGVDCDRWYPCIVAQLLAPSIIALAILHNVTLLLKSRRPIALEVVAAACGKDDSLRYKECVVLLRVSAWMSAGIVAATRRTSVGRVWSHRWRWIGRCRRLDRRVCLSCEQYHASEKAAANRNSTLRDKHRSVRPHGRPASPAYLLPLSCWYHRHRHRHRHRHWVPNDPRGPRVFSHHSLAIMLRSVV